LSLKATISKANLALIFLKDWGDFQQAAQH
jgi:hypothetical protein